MRQSAPRADGPNVVNQEDDGNGFFITGINTEDQNQAAEEGFERIDEEQEQIKHNDPADKFKHIAVVDCSKAFSNQEVSTNLVIQT